MVAAPTQQRMAHPALDDVIAGSSARNPQRVVQVEAVCTRIAVQPRWLAAARHRAGPFAVKSAGERTHLVVPITAAEDDPATVVLPVQQPILLSATRSVITVPGADPSMGRSGRVR